MDTFKFEIIGGKLLFDNAESMHGPQDPGMTTKPGKKQDATPQTLDAKLYLDDKGNLQLPSTAFRNALIAACKGRMIKPPKGKVVAAAGKFKGGVFTTSSFVSICDPKTKRPISKAAVSTDKRSAVNWNCKPPARIISTRPRIEAWSAIVEFEIDESLVNVELVEEIFQLAGKAIGVGAFRVEKGGEFGRFEVKLIR